MTFIQYACVTDGKFLKHYMLVKTMQPTSQEIKEYYMKH